VKPLRYGLLCVITIVAAAQPPKEAVEANAANERALIALEHGDTETARNLFSAAIQTWVTLGKSYEPHAATGMMNLGDTLCTMGRWNEAVKIFEQALVINRRSLGPKDLRTVGNLNRLANAYRVQGEPERAEPMYQEALAIERDLYPGQLIMAHTLECLASMHLLAGKGDAALPEAEEGLAIALKVAGENDAESGMAYAAVAQIHRTAGRTDRALPLFRKARAIFEHTLGPNNPRVGSVLSQEGLALLLENKLSLAEHDLTRAVELLSQPGAINVELAVAEQNLGLLRLRQKKYREADGLLSRALSIQEGYSMRPGSEMAATLQLLSDVREKEHRSAEAARLKARADTIATTTYR
jgi:tetratricopeptide (TPR) repeat protein